MQKYYYTCYFVWKGRGRGWNKAKLIFCFHNNFQACIHIGPSDRQCVTKSSLTNTKIDYESMTFGTSRWTHLLNAASSSILRMYKLYIYTSIQYDLQIRSVSIFKFIINWNDVTNYYWMNEIHLVIGSLIDHKIQCAKILLRAIVDSKFRERKKY